MSEAERLIGLATAIIDSLLDELVRIDPVKMHEWEMSEFDALEEPGRTYDEIDQGQMLREAIERAFDRAARPPAPVPANEDPLH